MYRILVSSCLAYEDFLLKKYIAIKYKPSANDCRNWKRLRERLQSIIYFFYCNNKKMHLSLQQKSIDNY